LGRGQLLNRLQELAAPGASPRTTTHVADHASKDAEVAQRNGLPVERKNLIPDIAPPRRWPRSPPTPAR
jgi:hypothetical protein